MATFFRKRIAHKLLTVFRQNGYCNEDVISPLIKVSRNNGKHPQLLLPFSKLLKATPEIGSFASFESVLKSLRNQGLPTAEGIIEIDIDKKIPQTFAFTVDKHVFNRIVLLDICLNSSDGLVKNSCLLQNIRKKRLLLEFRSPTIGKAFTTDHFHTAIHLNFMSRILKFLGMKTTLVNHVEDWGPSCGNLLAAYQCFGINEELENNAVQHLAEVLKAVQVKGRNNPTFERNVSDCINKMKCNDDEIMTLWSKLKKKWLKETNEIYKKLGIIFDETQFDSKLQEKIDNYTEELLQKDFDLENENAMRMEVGTTSSPVKETLFMDIHEHTLYSLARNIATTVHEKELFDFECMYFLGKDDQTEYYNKFFTILKVLGFSWSSDLSYVPITHAQWLNKRKKSVLPISFILDKTKTLTLQELKASASLELDDSADEVAENLAISGLVTQLFKHKRKDSVTFDIEESLQFSHNTGIAYQFLHTGLLNIQVSTDITFNFEIDLSPLGEYEAVSLVQHLARFDEIILKAFTYLEPYYIVQYIDSLCYLTRNAVDVLRLDIKEDRFRVIKARLLLFHAVQKTLCQCLKLIGLQPLEKIKQ